MMNDSNNTAISRSIPPDQMSSRLPPCFVAEILSRLCVKALLRFKSVCKSWYSVISNPKFQASHYKKSCQKPPFLVQFSNFNFHPYADASFRFSYNFAILNSQTNGIDYVWCIRVEDAIKLVLPGCFGLICFATDKRIHVCNPSTRKLLTLPGCRFGSSISGFGIGYLNSIRGHKIVRLIARRSRPFLNYRIECSVCTLAQTEHAGCSWKVLNDDCPYAVEQFSPPAFANETIYWKIDRQHHRVLHRPNDFIVGFNIRDEKFRTVTHPADWTPSTRRDWRCSIDSNPTHLVQMGEALFLVETVISSHVAGWALKDPRNNIWMKALMIDTRGINPNAIGEIKCFNNGEIMFSSASKFLLYHDFKKKRFRQQRIPFHHANVIPFWESACQLCFGGNYSQNQR